MKPADLVRFVRGRKNALGEAALDEFLTYMEASAHHAIAVAEAAPAASSEPPYRTLTLITSLNANWRLLMQS